MILLSILNLISYQGTKEVSKTSCDPCDAGTFQAAAGKDSCDACEAGTISAAQATECTECPKVRRLPIDILVNTMSF